MKYIHLFLLLQTMTTLIYGQTNWRSLVKENHPYSKSENCSIQWEAGQAYLHAEGGKAWMTIDGEYQDFKLRGEFLLKPENTGQIVFRLGDEDAPLPDLYGYAVQFDRDPAQQNCLGSINNVARAKWIENLDFEKWNSFEINATGDHLQVFIGQTMVTETHTRRSLNGVIKLIMNGTGPFFRNLEISELNNVSLSRPTTEDFLRSFPELDYVKIFDGKSLSGWSQTGTSEWTISEGALHGYSGNEGGFLISDDSYHNFHLKFKFKIADEDNSGIFIRRPASAPETTLQNSVECNIYDHNGFTHAFSTGALVTHARAWYHMIDYEDWNTGEIFALEDHIVMYINGQKASEAHLANYNHPGQLCLQAGLQLARPEKGPSQVYFKDIWIKCIDPNYKK